MISTRRTHNTFPILIITIMQLDPEVLRAGEDGRPVSVVKVQIVSRDKIEIEVTSCNGDGFGSPTIHAGPNAQRAKLLRSMVLSSSASMTEDSEGILAKVEEFLNEHIGTVREQAQPAL